MTDYILAIDQGTTNSRAIVFNSKGEPIAQHQIDLKQFFPKSGWVEQDPEEIWKNSLECCRQALTKSHLTAKEIAVVGITNQRETTIIWDKQTGKPIYPAIVWQDRRTIDICQQFKKQESLFANKTGLLLDPYFSATKIIWLLDNIPKARERAEKGELAFGTVDTFLLWKLTKGKVHSTDATNASRTLLFNIQTQQWDDEILKMLNIPKTLLPMVLDSSADFGKTSPELFGNAIPIGSLIGDQQAATVGQACFAAGQVKSTYGTGCFLFLNTGNKVIHSQNKLLSTIAYRLQGKVTYGLEGSIFCSGVTIKWLRDTLKIIQTAAETESLAASIDSTEGVYLIPAFTGLGAPYWVPEARAAIFGLNRNTGRAELARATLEAVAYQTQDLLTAMIKDSQTSITTLRVDGGMAANNWLLQFLADILNVEVQRPACLETTALGAAYLAGLQAGIFKSLDEIASLWQVSQVYKPKMGAHKREELYQGWKLVMEKILHSKC